MTYSELLNKVTFSELVPYLRDFEYDAATLAYMKMHYDRLRLLKPDATETSVAFITPFDEERMADDDPLLDCSDIICDTLEKALAKTIRIDECLHPSIEKLAAYCIAYSSGLGATPIMAETFRLVEQQEYAKAQMRHFRGFLGNVLPPKRKLSALNSFRQAVHRKMRQHRKWRPTKSDKEKYTIDGKRRWRYWKRQIVNAEYRRMVCINGGFIEHLLKDGKNILPPPSMKEMVRSLFSSNCCDIVQWQTYVKEASLRLEYCEDLIKNWHLLDSVRKSNSIVCISSPPKYPITDEEMRLLTLIKGRNSTFCIKADETLGAELRFDVAYFE